MYRSSIESFVEVSLRKFEIWKLELTTFTTCSKDVSAYGEVQDARYSLSITKLGNTIYTEKKGESHQKCM